MNTYGHHFRISIYGESHGADIGVLIDGCPAGINLSADDFMHDLSRRRSGAKGTTHRTEDDIPILRSGIYQGYTTGAPIHVLFENQNVDSAEYEKTKDIPRPGHADWVAFNKFNGYNDPRGGGHFSGRLTLTLVAAGVIAKKIFPDLIFTSSLVQAGGSHDIEEAVNKVLAAGDSIGGIVECRVKGIPVGVGEPFFNSLESCISHLAFSIPAVRGIEFGDGFAATALKGSEHNDEFRPDGSTFSNHSGGINGGISNGNEMIFRLAVKPTSSISIEQRSFNMKTGIVERLSIRGRHDSCIALRIPVIAEAIAAIALADLMQRPT